MPQNNVLGYLRPLGKHSILILLIAVSGVLLGLLGSILFSDLLSFEAQAVIISKTSEADRLVLTSPDGSAFRQNTTPDSSPQIRNMQVLISGQDVATDVMTSLKSSQDPAAKDLLAFQPIQLQDKITVESRGDLLYIKAHASNTAAATLLANTWADQAIAKINKIYTVSSSQVGQAVDQAKAELDTAQKELEQFLATSPQNAREQELSQVDSFIAAASTNYTTTQAILYNSARQAQQNRLTALYTYSNTLQQQAGAIAALRTRVEQSPDQADALYSNQITLLVLFNKVIADMPSASSSSDLAQPNLPSASTLGSVQTQLQFSLADAGKSSITKAGQLQDVDSTLAAVRKLQGDAQIEIQTLVSQLNEPMASLPDKQLSDLPPVVQSAIARKSQLESEVEHLKSQLTELQKTQQLRQDAYQLLRSRLAEQQVNEQINRVVDMGTPADEASTARTRSALRTLTWFALQGLLVATVLGILLAYFLQLVRPELSTNAALKRRLRRSPAAGGRTARVGTSDSGT